MAKTTIGRQIGRIDCPKHGNMPYVTWDYNRFLACSKCANDGKGPSLIDRHPG